MVPLLETKFTRIDLRYERIGLNTTTKKGIMSLMLYSLYDWREEVQNVEEDDLRGFHMTFQPRLNPCLDYGESISVIKRFIPGVRASQAILSTFIAILQ
jgi:hypothetical protein